jgi:hypothetical protein
VQETFGMPRDIIANRSDKLVDHLNGSLGAAEAAMEELRLSWAAGRLRLSLLFRGVYNWVHGSETCL